jgi:ketosteroid isomerase-like protein
VSEANALLARRWFELMNESARSRVFPEPEVEQMVDPDIRLDMSRNAFNPGTYSGVDGFRRMFEGIWDVWEQFEFVPLEVVAEGDKVAIRVELRGRGRDGIKAARQFGTLFTIRDDRVVEFVGRMEWQAAVEGARA